MVISGQRHTEREGSGGSILYIRVTEVSVILYMLQFCNFAVVDGGISNCLICIFIKIARHLGGGKGPSFVDFTSYVMLATWTGPLFSS